jgi:hypothetical protein
MFGPLRIGLVLAVFGVLPVQATDAPVIVIPGKAGVPVIINGYDASYTVVEGDVGLDRPGHMPATIVSGPLIAPDRRYYGHYFPALGRRPGYGRREIEPPANRKLPPPAQNFERFWGIESAPSPANTEPQSQRTEINADVNVDPSDDDDRDRNPRDRRKRRVQGDHRDHRIHPNHRNHRVYQR